MRGDGRWQEVRSQCGRCQVGQSPVPHPTGSLGHPGVPPLQPLLQPVPLPFRSIQKATLRLWPRRRRRKRTERGRLKRQRRKTKRRKKRKISRPPGRANGGVSQKVGPSPWPACPCALGLARAHHSALSQVPAPRGLHPRKPRWSLTASQPSRRPSSSRTRATLSCGPRSSSHSRMGR